MGRKIRVWTILSVLTVVVAGLAPAQTVTPIDTTRVSATTLGFGLQAGYLRSSGADQGAYYFGGVARYKLAPTIGLEGTIGYRASEVFNFGTVSGNELFADVSTIPLTVSLLVWVPLRSSSFVPYGVLGIGAYLLSIDYSPDINKVMGDETKVKFGGHLGAGVDLMLSQAVSAHVDYRYLFLSKIFNSTATYDFSSKDYNGGAITFGMMFSF